MPTQREFTWSGSVEDNHGIETDHASIKREADDTFDSVTINSSQLFNGGLSLPGEFVPNADTGDYGYGHDSEYYDEFNFAWAHESPVPSIQPVAGKNVFDALMLSFQNNLVCEHAYRNPFQINGSGYVKQLGQQLQQEFPLSL